MMWFETILQDLRYATRTFQRSPGFTAAAVLALGLGIGVNTAIFTSYKAMVARPLDAVRPQEMVNLSLVHESGISSFTFSYPDYQAYRDSIRSFSGLVAFSPEHMRFSHSFKSQGNKPVVVSVFVVSRNYFRVLGIDPMRGGGFDAGTLPALPALISEDCWEKRFARDSAVLGRVSVRESPWVNGVVLTLVRPLMASWYFPF